MVAEKALIRKVSGGYEIVWSMMWKRDMRLYTYCRCTRDVSIVCVDG